MSRVRIPFPAQLRAIGARGLSVIAPNVSCKIHFLLKWPRRPQSHQVAGFCFTQNEEVVMASYPSGKGEVCKTFMRRFESARRLWVWLPDRPLSGRFNPVSSFRTCIHQEPIADTAFRCRQSRGGGIGRRTGLKILRAERSVPVQVRPSVRVQSRLSRGLFRAVSSVG